MVDDWKPDYTVTPQRVVCAANRLNKNGIIVLGVRHCDQKMHETITLRKQLYADENWFQCEQGFVDQFGNFLTRKEAWVIAVKQCQIYRLVGSQDKGSMSRADVELFSENLY